MANFTKKDLDNLRLELSNMENQQGVSSKKIEELRKEIIEAENILFNQYFDNANTLWLSDVPDDITTLNGDNKYNFYYHSVLNVDVIASAIALYFQEYEGRDAMAYRCDKGSIYLPSSVISDTESFLKREEDGSLIKNIKAFREDDHSIVIDYNHDFSIRKYPTDEPVKVLRNPRNVLNPYVSNYQRFFIDGKLNINAKNRAFIRELVYSLIFYQYNKGIGYMNFNKTMDVLAKIDTDRRRLVRSKSA